MNIKPPQITESVSEAKVDSHLFLSQNPVFL